MSGTIGPPAAHRGSPVPEQPGRGTGTGGRTVAEAAEILGITERAVRKRIAAGKLAGHYDGKAWTVYLPVPEQCSVGAGTGPESGDQGPEPAELEALTKALEMIEQLQVDAVRRERENLELAGRCGFLQAKLQDAEKQILALQAPQEPEPKPARPSLWRRLLGLSPA